MLRTLLRHLLQVVASRGSRAGGDADQPPTRPRDAPRPFDLDVGGVPIDIIVPVHDALDDVIRCLDSIRRSTLLSHRVIVVDDGSGPETATHLVGRGGIHLIRTEARQGRARSLNTGIQACRSPWFVVLDGPLVVTRGWLARLNAALHADPGTGIAGPLSNAPADPSSSCFFAPGSPPRETGSSFPDADGLAELLEAAWEPRFPSLPILDGPCLAIDRRVTEATGDLSESGDIPDGSVLTELCSAARRAGFDTVLADNCYVHRPGLGPAGGERTPVEQPDPLAALRRRLARIRDQDARLCTLLPADATPAVVQFVLQVAQRLAWLGVDATVVAAESLDIGGRVEPGHHLETYASTAEVPDLCGGCDLLVVPQRSAVALAEAVHQVHPTAEVFLIPSGPDHVDPERRSRLKESAFLATARTNYTAEALTQHQNLQAVHRTRRALPRTDIIIPVRDKPDLTGACLESLLERTDYGEYRVLVVDNASQAETADLLADLARRDPRLTVLTNAENASFAAANNQACAKGDGELLLFLNNDTEIIQPEWLTLLVRALLERPLAAAVGPRLLYPDRARVQSAGIEIQIGASEGNLVSAKEIRTPEPSRTVDGLTAACMLTWRDVFLSVGGFDEAYTYGQEDIDLCLAYRLRGFSLFHCALARIVHREASTRNYDEITARNREIIRAKWDGKLRNLARWM